MGRNNKGFSLVELIIVIAIMAVLVGIVGTQVIPYLERSRQAKDFQIFSSWNTAGMSAYSINAGKLDSLEAYVIIVTNSSVTCADNSLDAADSLVDSFCQLTGLKKSGGTNQITKDMDSKAGKLVKSVVVSINPGDDAINGATTKIYLDESHSSLCDDFEVIENH